MFSGSIQDLLKGLLQNSGELGNNFPLPFVSEISLPRETHNRYLTGITATWPNNDTFSVVWTPLENVREYRLLVIGTAAGAFVRYCEDAANEAQAAAWLVAETTSRTADVMSRRAYAIASTSVPLQGNWTEWQPLSKVPSDSSLSRLDFLASAAGPYIVRVETR